MAQDPENVREADPLGSSPLTLNGKPEYCMLCPLFQEPGPVHGTGDPNAKIMLVGEAPGEEEARFKKPFIGGSGRVLNRQLRQAGIDRDSCFVTNVVRCRPQRNRTPTDDEIRHCAPFLARELAAVRPNVVIALGATPLYAFTGRTGIYNQRGVPIEADLGTRKQKIFATLHPAHIMRSQEMWPVAVYDLTRAKAQSAFPEVRRRPCEYVLDASIKEHGEYILRTARERGCADFDLETTNLDPRTSQIICIGLAVDEDRAFCFRWTPQAAEFFQTLAGDPRVEIEGQNIESFDIPFCEEKGIRFEGPTFDLLQGFHLTNSDQPKNLGYIMSLYTDMEYHKDTAKENLFLYNAKDTLGQKRSCVEVRKEIHEYGMDHLYRTVMLVQPILRKAHRLGLKKDAMKAARWSIGLDRTARAHETTLQAAIGVDFNCHSPKQLMDILYNKLGLPVQYTKDPKTKQMRPTANAEAIAKLAEISDDPVLALINKVRQLDHTRVTYVEVESDDNDFVHPRFGTAKAATGRLNSWDPNFQNVPVELRELYIPDSDEHVIITFDWSQVETRIAMVLSADPVGLEILASGQDILKSIAAEAYGVALADVTDDLRYLAKFIWYGLAYGRGAKDIARQTKRPLGEVETFIAKLFRRFNKWLAWRKALESQVERDSCIINPFARRRWWYTRQITEVYNFPIQSTGADMMYETLVKMDSALPKGSSIRFTVHDDIGVVAPKDEAKQVWDTMQAIMQDEWPQIVEHSLHPEIVKQFYPTGFRCKAEGGIGNNWAECKKGNKDLMKHLGVLA